MFTLRALKYVNAPLNGSPIPIIILNHLDMFHYCAHQSHTTNRNIINNIKKLYVHNVKIQVIETGRHAT